MISCFKKNKTKARPVAYMQTYCHTHVAKQKQKTCRKFKTLERRKSVRFIYPTSSNIILPLIETKCFFFF